MTKGSSPASNHRTAADTIEVAGLTVVFRAVNLRIGLAVALGSRARSMRFTSVYVVRP